MTVEFEDKVHVIEMEIKGSAEESLEQVEKRERRCGKI